MTKKILVLTGSARPNSIGDKILPLISDSVARHEGYELDIAKAKDLDLPFFNEKVSPSTEGFEPTNQKAAEWSKRVEGADAVIWLMPEYNHAMTAIQKNAIDWLFREWNSKPLGIVTYGAYGGKHALEVAKNVFDTIQPDYRGEARFTLGEEIEFDGEIAKRDFVVQEIDKVVDALV